MRYRPLVVAAVLAVVAALIAACTSGPAVNTGDISASEPAPPPPSLRTPANNLHLANAYDYFADAAGRPGYYFRSPSGRWRCAIVPHSKAGCQSASGSVANIQGAPETVTGADGASAVPNAIVVDNDGGAHFAALRPGELSPGSGTAKALPFNEVLDAAGFRCNAQASAGMSCASDVTAKGFTFSRDGYTLRYTDVPDNARP